MEASMQALYNGSCPSARHMDHRNTEIQLDASNIHLLSLLEQNLVGVGFMYGLDSRIEQAGGKDNWVERTKRAKYFERAIRRRFNLTSALEVWGFEMAPNRGALLERTAVMNGAFVKQSKKHSGSTNAFPTWWPVARMYGYEVPLNWQRWRLATADTHVR